MLTITSLHNPLVKRMKSLLSARGRRQEGAFIAEGEVMIREALSNGFPPARVVTLKNPSHGKAPWLDEPMFSGIDLKVGNCAYGVSKAAMIAFTKTLAAECGPLGVRVNAICPGLSATDMGAQMEEKAGREMIARSAMNRLAEPEEIARAAVFLASDGASFVNGQILSVDGGRA